MKSLFFTAASSHVFTSHFHTLPMAYAHLSTGLMIEQTVA